MSIFDVLSLFGGLCMFLYGMRLMGDSLKENSSGTLKVVMEKVTNDPVRAFALGAMVTALIQSSTATIVITSGLVAGGILTLHQSMGIIVGANVGTTVTGQIIRLLDLDASGGVSWLRFLQPSTLAPVALIIGMSIIMSGRLRNAKSIGSIAVGFGILFTGLLNMTNAVDVLAESGMVGEIFAEFGSNPILGYLAGFGVSFVLQSSSASIGILQAFSSTGLLTFKAVYTIILGIYLGDCLTTAIVCFIGSKADSKRVGVVNVLYNLSKTAIVICGVMIAHAFGFIKIWDSPVNSGIIANANTIFNLVSAVLLLPFLGIYERQSRAIVKDEAVKKGKYDDKIAALSPAFYSTPALALKSCYDILLTMFTAARSNLQASFGLFKHYDEKVKEEIFKEEESVDLMTDRVSRYIVDFLPRVRSRYNISIINQYYKVSNEFERLSDHAVNIANNAANFAKEHSTFSPKAMKELEVMEDLTNEILDYAEKSFKNRSKEASEAIEPLVQVVAELTAQIKRNHLNRMSSGECNPLVDAGFSNMLSEFKRIADVCSNIGIATMVRIRPELADHEHLYFENMHSGGGDSKFHEAFEKSYAFYIDKLK